MKFNRKTDGKEFTLLGATTLGYEGFDEDGVITTVGIDNASIIVTRSPLAEVTWTPSAHSAEETRTLVENGTLLKMFKSFLGGK